MARKMLYPKTKKKNLKRKILILVVIILLLTIIFFGFYKMKVKNERVVFRSPIIFINQNSFINEKRMASPIQNGVTIEVLDKKIVPSEQKKDSSVTLELEIRTKNNLTKAININYSDFLLIKDDVSFEPELNFATDFLYQDAINPDITITRKLAFKVSEETALSKKVLLVTDSKEWISNLDRPISN